MFDGYGVIEWNDGNRYEGYFKKDLADGKGIHIILMVQYMKEILKALEVVMVK